MKTLQILLLTTGVALFLALAGCGKEERPMPPMPSLPKDTVVQYARDISFDSLTAGQVYQFLQNQGKWKIEAQYMSPVGDLRDNFLYYYPLDTGNYVEFVGNDSLRFFTDTGVVTEKIRYWYSTGVSTAHVAYQMPGISNYRLVLNTTADRYKRFFCIPEAINLEDLPQPNLAQKESLLDLPVYQIMQLLSGTKWKVWKKMDDDGQPWELEADTYYGFEFVGTDSLHLVNMLGYSTMEIGALFEVYSGGTPLTYKSFYAIAYVNTPDGDLSDRYEVYILELSEKKIKIGMVSISWTHSPYVRYYADLVE